MRMAARTIRRDYFGGRVPRTATWPRRRFPNCTAASFIRAWGHSVWYFEVDADGWPIRQIEVYDVGPVIRYGPEHEEDRYGGLGQASLDDSGEDWSPYAITRGAFERVWDSAGG